MQIVASGVLVEYSDTGSGEVLLCVHGWMDSKSAYDKLAANLKADYRIVALDLPNFGASQMTDTVVTTKNYADFLAAFITKLNLKNYTLVGHSMGCQIALYGTANKIVMPQKLVLLAPAGVRNKNRLLKKALRVGSILMKPIVPKSYKKKFYKMIGSDYDPSMLEIHKRIIKHALATDIQAVAAGIAIPVLIINGRDDKSTPLWMAQTLAAQIPYAKLEVLDNEGHHLQRTAADTVAQLIRKFLQ